LDECICLASVLTAISPVYQCNPGNESDLRFWKARVITRRLASRDSPDGSIHFSDPAGMVEWTFWSTRSNDGGPEARRDLFLSGVSGPGVVAFISGPRG